MLETYNRAPKSPQRSPHPGVHSTRSTQPRIPEGKLPHPLEVVATELLFNMNCHENIVSTLFLQDKLSFEAIQVILCGALFIVRESWTEPQVEPLAAHSSGPHRSQFGRTHPPWERLGQASENQPTRTTSARNLLPSLYTSKAFEVNYTKAWIERRTSPRSIQAWIKGICIATPQNY